MLYSCPSWSIGCIYYREMSEHVQPEKLLAEPITVDDEPMTVDDEPMTVDDDPELDESNIE